MQMKEAGGKQDPPDPLHRSTHRCFYAEFHSDKEEMNMKKNLGIAVKNFFGIAVLVGLLDLLAARFSLDVFAQTLSRPGHIAFICVLGLILAVGAFIRPSRKAQNA